MHYLWFALIGFAQIAGASPALHPQEIVPASEEAQISRITAIIKGSVEKQFSKDGFATRDAHARHHGCVNAKFTVLKNLPAEYAVGVFSKPGPFPAWIRFSNGMGTVIDDRKGDARGMAIKLMNVPGEKVLDEERDAKTQDFLMINHPVFFVRNVSDYVKFSEAVGSGSPLSFFLSWNPFKWHIHEMRIANAIRTKTVTNPLAIAYYSTTPILMGDRPAKYSARPCPGQKFVSVPSSSTQLREAMELQLRPEDGKNGVCFEFGVQLQTNPRKMPVEDPTIEWSEKSSKFVTVATIEIPRQQFLAKEALDFCENLSLTPWHALPEHRPIGGIQRARKQIYQTISEVRHKLNKKPSREP